MNLLVKRPWTLWNDASSDFDKLFEGLFGKYPEDNGNVITSSWSPAVDIKEEETQYVVVVDIPGVDPSEIDVTTKDGVLTIKGERVKETRDEEKGYTRVERAHGMFHRRFTLPESADAEKISAKGKDGVLEVVIPKREESQPRRITVSH
ncbi:MAG: Hsp20/alpha crystallin family protein [Gammaproteobacteria bacterium]